MKAVILARVSTKEQEEFGHSLPAQVQKLQEYAEKKGFEVIKEFSFSESAGTESTVTAPTPKSTALTIR